MFRNPEVTRFSKTKNCDFIKNGNLLISYTLTDESIVSTTLIYFITERLEKTIFSFSQNNLEIRYAIYKIEYHDSSDLLNLQKRNRLVL